MKIVFTGGGTGGHFYPIIAIVEAVHDLVRENKLVQPKLYFFAPAPYDEQALYENSVTFVAIPAGKMRRYTSARNVLGILKVGLGLLAALLKLFQVYPDVVVSKGGYGSVPTILAARILGIPVVIHESDAKPGRANLMAGKFAKKIAISFDSAAKYFPKEAQSRIARTGVPIRKALLRTEEEGAAQYLHLETALPTVFILGGSQGSQRINETVLSALPSLVAFANVLHQAGKANIASVMAVAQVTLDGNPHKDRYHPFAFLSEMALQRAAGAASIVISRAGATAIAEISVWKKPSILIPIPEAVSHDQRTNAYAYARTGAALVIEEENLSPNLFVSEIKRVLKDQALMTQMRAESAKFTDTDAARLLAQEILSIALAHE